MSGPGPVAGDWGMQQVAGFLAAISTLPDESSMTRAAVQRIAEAVDAEVCALVTRTAVSASVGFPADLVPVDALLDVAWRDRRSLPAPGLGDVDAVPIELHLEAPSRLVVARSEDPLDRHDVHVLRTMAQVLDLALNLRRVADRERALREASEQQSADLRSANQRLAEASRVKSDLISVASHELRTPLTSIIGFTELLLRHGSRLDAEQHLGHLERVHHHGRRLLRLVDDLLLVGRIDSGAVRAEAAAVDLIDACATVATHLTLRLRVAADDRPHALVDPGHLEQILTNLLTNARKYGREPFEARIEERGATVRIAVVDHGDGVPSDFESKLFERFAQASTGDARNATGTGLGLSIVTGLVEANGGAVRYERCDDEVRFLVDLPRATGARTRAPNPEAAQRRSMTPSKSLR
ncbi:MAG TPA: HAMP domain-containing sensor histidine kinase [Nitriliruptorales bacterium]